MFGLLDGLRHSHENGVVHRDIKPHNVVFSEDGNLKITDFGIARLDSGGVTLDGSTLGTPAYMSPEQAMGETADARSDLYATGVILFEMLSGRRPFEGSAQSLMHKIVNAPVPRLADLSLPLPSRFDALLARAMAKAPGDRFQSAAEMWQALQAAFLMPEPPTDRPSGEDTILQGKEFSPRRKPALAAPRSKPLRLKLPLVAGAVAIAVIGTGVWLLLTHAAPTPDHQMAVAAATSGVPPVSVVAPIPPALIQPDIPGPVIEKPAPPPADPVDGWRRAIAGIIAAAPCSLLKSNVSARGEVVLTGLTGLSDSSQLEISASLRHAMAQAFPLASMVWNVLHVDGPYCSVFSLLQPFVAEAGTAELKLAISASQDGGQAVQSIAGRVASSLPNITVDRFTMTGQVEHLRHREAPTTVGASGSIPLMLDDKNIGTGELIVAIAASAVLLPSTGPEQEDSSAYVAKLRAAIERAQRSGVRIVGDAGTVAGR
jgi:serine/threonine-protein kinase